MSDTTDFSAELETIKAKIGDLEARISHLETSVVVHTESTDEVEE